MRFSIFHCYRLQAGMIGDPQPSLMRRREIGELVKPEVLRALREEVKETLHKLGVQEEIDISQSPPFVSEGRQIEKELDSRSSPLNGMPYIEESDIRCYGGHGLSTYSVQRCHGQRHLYLFRHDDRGGLLNEGVPREFEIESRTDYPIDWALKWIVGLIIGDLDDEISSLRLKHALNRHGESKQASTDFLALQAMLDRRMDYVVYSGRLQEVQVPSLCCYLYDRSFMS